MLVAKSRVKNYQTTIGDKTKRYMEDKNFHEKTFLKAKRSSRPKDSCIK